MNRYLEPYIFADLGKKIVLLTGPRQVGKTTLSKMLSRSFDYFNFDNPEHRLALRDRSWDRKKELVIFDELHKLKKWKSWLKGVYDTEDRHPGLLVTGSAKLDTYRKVGDSLAGRFFQFRLHPLDLKEISSMAGADTPPVALEKLLATGGFPEPYLEGNNRFYRRWQKSHLDIILKQDLIELENVHDIVSIETLIQMLRSRVGSTVSCSALARDLQVSDKTVKRWLVILENMYVIFRVTPLHKNIARSILKSPKFYFYDTGQVLGDQGTRLENLTACALMKEIHYQEDCHGRNLQLNFLRTKDGREIDFCLSSLTAKQATPLLLLEVKWADDKPSRHFPAFAEYFPQAVKLQLVEDLAREKSYPNGLEIRKASQWLTSLEIPE